MTFEETLGHVIALLQREGRVTYRALKRHFDLDDDYLADLTAELIEAKRLAVDEDGKVLVWTGGAGSEELENRRTGVAPSSPQPLTRNTQSPAAYTPSHLAERIRAEQA